MAKKICIKHNLEHYEIRKNNDSIITTQRGLYMLNLKNLDRIMPSHLVKTSKSYMLTKVYIES